MDSEKMQRKFRYVFSEDEFPHRRVFETRYYAQKYMDEFYPEKDKKFFLIQKDPFNSYDGYCIIFLNYV